MGAYIERLLDVDPVEAKRVQKAHFHEHGTTLAGLMAEHQVDPHDFLGDVHDIPLDRIVPDERLAVGLARLPGRKFVFTNGDAPYARRVLEAIGVHTHLGSHDHASSYRPKLDPHAMRSCVTVSGSILSTRFGRRHGAEPVPRSNSGHTICGQRLERGNHGDEALVDVRVADVGDHWKTFWGTRNDGRPAGLIERAWTSASRSVPHGRRSPGLSIRRLRRSITAKWIAEKLDGAWTVHQWLKKSCWFSSG
jgi:putative hydrolase of the HAD superfamily